MDVYGAGKTCTPTSFELAMVGRAFAQIVTVAESYLVNAVRRVNDFGEAPSRVSPLHRRRRWDIMRHRPADI